MNGQQENSRDVQDGQAALSENGGSILILGAGQVGLEVGRLCRQFKPNKIVLHCLTLQEAEDAASKLKAKFGDGSETEFVSSYGNILWPAYLARKIKPIDSSEERTLLHYFYDELSPELVESSLLYKLIEEHKPRFIIDAINIATAVGYQQCVHDAVRKALENENNPDYKGSYLYEIAKSVPSPPIIRFVQSLQCAMKEFSVERYIKISTTGLGGMGFNIKYTHGDLGEEGLSTKLLGKVSAAGILFKLLLTLSHTPGFNVNVVVPAALIGWEEMGRREVSISAKGKNIPLIDSDPVPLSSIADVKNENYKSYIMVRRFNENLRDVVVKSGENNDYGWHDMASITAPGQMGCITKEEVAEAVIDIIHNKLDKCALRAFDVAQMNCTERALEMRKGLMEKMENMAKELGVPSTSYMNLGPKIAKYLWELEIISKVTSSFKEALNTDPENLTANAERFIKDNKRWRAIILTCGLAIITQNYLYCPESMKDEKGKPLLSFSEIIASAPKQCVDLRLERIAEWKAIFDNLEKVLNSRQLPEMSNYDQIILDKPIKPGELMAFWFTTTGGEKKII